jgi:type VI secretion system protein ImpB
MSSESLQHNLDRVRRPRVQITYDVETGGAMEKKELPFVVGVMADLSAQSNEPQKAPKERKFVPIDRDNFNDVLAKSKPRLAMKVTNRLTDEATDMPVELQFESMDDFEPAKVAEQVPALKKILDIRGKLNELLGKMEGNEELENLLGEVLSSTEQAQSLAQEIGLDADGDSGDEKGDSEEAKDE